MPPKKQIATKKRVAVKKPTLVHKPVQKKTTVKEKTSQPIHVPGSMPLAMYRHIALTFVVLVAFALISVLYLATMQAVIHVDPVESTVNAEFIVQATETQVSESEIPAEVLSGTIGKTQTFVPTGEGAKEIPGIATGQVTIYNDMTFDQALVATTRLLTLDNVLFRLLKGVTVPAGSSVIADVYADKEGASGDIAATSFTIPGLSAARQALVYAKSTETFTGGVNMISVVSEEEINAAVAVVESALLEDAKSMLHEESSKQYKGEVFEAEIVDKTFSINPGTTADSYDVTMTLKVNGVFYDSDSLLRLAEIKLYQGLGQGREFLNTDFSGAEVSLESSNEEFGTASLRVTLAGQAIASRTSEALDVQRFVGMKEAEVKDLLVGEGIARDVSVDFFPFWVRKIPRLKDHIYIEID